MRYKMNFLMKKVKFLLIFGLLCSSVVYFLGCLEIETIVNNDNNIPIANAGIDQIVNVNSQVQLDGSASSDPDDDPLTYKWIVTDKNPEIIELSSSNAMSPTFTPSKIGIYRFQLIVNDGEMDSVAVDVIVIVEELPPNQIPIANAGLDQTVVINKQAQLDEDEIWRGDAINPRVQLDGSASSDPDGDSLTYQWSIKETPTGSQLILLHLSSSIEKKLVFVPHFVGTYRFELIVHDGEVYSAPDIVTITVTSDLNKAPVENQPPIAEAGIDQTVGVNTRVQLDGSSSSDPDGNAITYRWTSGANNPTIFRLVSTSENLYFTPSIVGTYQFELIVHDGEVYSTPDIVTITVVQPNRAPIAEAGIDQTVNINTQVQLDGSSSSDPDGNAITYQWSVLSDTLVGLSSTTSSKPTFTPSIVGTYRFELIVHDGEVYSAPDIVTITVTSDLNKAPVENQPPIAEAGIDQTVDVNTRVQLDGSSSSDPDGNAITYQWSVLSDTLVGLSSTKSSKPTFTPSIVGTYRFELIVHDGEVYSTPDIVTITVVQPNRAPIAKAGIDQTVDVNTRVQLDGSSSSDPDGNAITYQWSVLSDTLVGLSSTKSSKPTFTPSIVGTYRFELIVHDGEVYSTPDIVTITVVQPNRAPIAEAGIDQTVDVNTRVQLDGSSSSDPDGNAITYQWSVLSDTLVGLSSTTSSKPTFTPSIVGTYRFELIVHDGEVYSTPDIVTITVVQPNEIPATENQPPIANAGKDIEINVNTLVILDGSASSDPDRDSLTYQWTEDTSNPISFRLAVNSRNPYFTPTIVGTYRFELIVHDGEVYSTPDIVTITVIQPNRAPIANAGKDIETNVNTLVILDGSASSDPDRDSLTYQWTEDTSNPISFRLAVNSRNPYFTPTIVGTYRFELIVHDGEVYSTPDIVTITVIQPNRAPIANAGEDQTVKVNTQVHLNGSSSSDPDGNAITYQWTADDSNPSQVTLSYENSARANFTPTVAGQYYFTLTVSDGRGGTDSDQIRIHVNTPPIARAGEDQRVEQGTQVQLDGSQSSDPDKEEITYRWHAFQGNPSSVILSSTTDSSPTFIAPNIPGQYLFYLTVRDGVFFEIDSVKIEVFQNQIPIANAGLDQTVDINTQVRLDGSKSVDSDQSPNALTYLWEILDGNPDSVILSSATVSRPTFTPKIAGRYHFKLTVSDGKDASGPDAVVINVNNPPPPPLENRAPIANAGSDQTGSLNVFVTLNGELSTDLDNNPLTYQWTADSNNPEQVTLIGSVNNAKWFFKASTPGEYRFSLIVNDRELDSSPDEVIITIRSFYTVENKVDTQNNYLWESVAYGKGIIVAVGSKVETFNGNSYYTGILSYSEDKGKTWTQVINGGDGFKNIIYANDKFTAIGRSGRIAHSLDGKTWNNNNANVQFNGIDAIEHFNAIAYNSNQGQYLIGGGSSGGGVLAYSADGNNFQSVQADINDYWISAVFANNTFYVVGNNGRLAKSSDNGTNWSYTTIDSSYPRLLTIAYYDKFLIAYGSKYVITSSDGKNWDSSFAYDADTHLSTVINQIRHVQNTYILVGNNFVAFSTTAAENSWYTLRNKSGAQNSISELSGDWLDVSYIGNNQYVVVGTGGQIIVIQRNGL